MHDGLRPNMLARAIIRADKDDFAVADGECLRPWLLPVYGLDLARVIHGVSEPGNPTFGCLDKRAVLANKLVTCGWHRFRRLLAGSEEGYG